MIFHGWPVQGKVTIVNHQGRSSLLRGSLPKSVPLDFGLEKTFAL